MARLASFAVSLLLVAFSAVAAPRLPDSPQDVLREQAQLRQTLETSPDRYKHLDADERKALLERQARLTEQLGSAARWEDLPEADRERIAQEHAAILAAVQEPQSDRRICTNERVLGSQRIQRVCRSAEDVERERRQARDNMLKATRCGTPNCIVN